MIIGKYFKSPLDYINVMRVCKKYENLTLMYRYNPIGDTTLFPNIQTQHFYRKHDFITVVPRMYRYVYWGTFTKNFESAVKKVNRRKYAVNKYDESPNIADKLISKNLDHKHIMELLDGLPFRCDKLIYDSTVQDGDAPDYYGMAIQIFYDSDNNSIAFFKGVRTDNDIHYSQTVPSLARVSYYDSITDIKVFRQDNKNFIIGAKSYGVDINFSTGAKLFFRATKNEQNKYTMAITNRGFTYKELSSLMFPSYIVSRTNPSLVRFRVARYALYTVKDFMCDKYYASLLQQSFGRNFNVLVDSWCLPYYCNYNLGYLRYIYCDALGNSIMFNVLPTQIIITVAVQGTVKNIKPLCEMNSVIRCLVQENVYNRYDFFTQRFAKYYNATWCDIIAPLKAFCPVRLLVCTNSFTRCSCVTANNYFVKVRDCKFVNY